MSASSILSGYKDKEVDALIQINAQQTRRHIIRNGNKAHYFCPQDSHVGSRQSAGRVEACGMSGLPSLLDDVAALAKLAAVHIDDVASQASRTGVKIAGSLIDDAAVTPRYVQNLPVAREVPTVWKIARGSILNAH